MRRKPLWALLITLVVSGAVAACHHYGLGQALADWLAGRVESLAGMRRVPALQHAAYWVSAALAAWFGLTLTGTARRAGFLLALSFLILALWPVLALQGVFFEPFFSLAAASVAGGLAMLLDVGAARREAVAAPFAGRLSREAFAAFWRQGGQRQLTGRRQVTVLSCRLLNEAALLKELEPERWQELSGELNRRLRELLLAHDAFLEMTSPAEVRALFGFPKEDENHAVAAARAALECRGLLAGWEREMLERWGARPSLGLALSSGEVVMSLQTDGGHEAWRANGTVLALSAELGAMNLRYGSRLLASAAILSAAAGGLEVRPLDMLPQGESGALAEIYEVLALKHGLSEEQAMARDAFWQGVILLRKGDLKGARRQFERAELEGVEDVVLAHFKARTRETKETAPK